LDFVSRCSLDNRFVGRFGPCRTRFYQLPLIQKVMDLILGYSIFVGVVFVIWLLFVIRMYNKLND